MPQVIVERISDKLMVAIPEQIERELAVHEGDALDMARNEDALLMSAPAPSLEQLVEEHKSIAHLLEDDRAWIDAPRVGRELI